MLGIRAQAQPDGQTGQQTEERFVRHGDEDLAAADAFQLGQGRGYIRQMLQDLAAYHQIERGWGDRETIDVRLLQLDPCRALPPRIGDGAGAEIAAGQTPKRPLFGEIQIGRASCRERV